MEARIDFIILENIPFSPLIIELRTLKQLGGGLDFLAEEVRLDYRVRRQNSHGVRVYTVMRVNPKDRQWDFTSDSDGAEPSLGAKGEAENELREKLVQAIQGSWTSKVSIASGH